MIWSSSGNHSIAPCFACLAFSSLPVSLTSIPHVFLGALEALSICSTYRFRVGQIPRGAVVVNPFQEFPAVGIRGQSGRRVAVGDTRGPARDHFFANVVVYGHRTYAEADFRL